MIKFLFTSTMCCNASAAQSRMLMRPKILNCNVSKDRWKPKQAVIYSLYITDRPRLAQYCPRISS